MFIFFKKHINVLLITLFIFLNACQLQEPTKNHGILFLENRAKKLTINSNNQNDVLKLIGNPHTKSVDNDNSWIYIERVLTKGSYHQLGKNIVKSNNVLILTFDKYGILVNKSFLNKDDIKKLKFSKKVTENNLSKQSFVQSFLASIKAKMYANK
jgi:outer membrane protein assembly factor BamE (lipoprotein component of BamABCDE complex)